MTTLALGGAMLLASILNLNLITANSTPSYTKLIPMGVGALRVDRRCVLLGAFLTAGDFFEGLKRVETHSGTEFRKGSSVVQHFPELITVKIRAHVEECTDAPPQSPLTDSPNPFKLSSLRFSAQWKSGLRLRPVENMTFEGCQTAQSQLDTTSVLLLKQMGIHDPGAKTWICELSIHEHGVPLTDHLILTVARQDGTGPLRFSAQL